MKIKLKHIYNYKTRVGEDNSRVHISHSYRAKGYGTLYYVFIEHKKIQGVYEGGLSVMVTKESLEKSVTNIIENEAAKDMEDGLEMWKEHFTYEGEIPYSETLAEILNLEEDE